MNSGVAREVAERPQTHFISPVQIIQHQVAQTTICLSAAIFALGSCNCAGASRPSEAERSPSPATDAAGSDTGSSSPEVGTMKLNVITEDEVLTATLDDNAATRDSVSLLPLSLTLRDHAGTEKVSDLPRRLSTSGTPPGVDPELGELAYYAPWGNLAILLSRLRVFERAGQAGPDRPGGREADERTRRAHCAARAGR